MSRKQALTVIIDTSQSMRQIHRNLAPEIEGGRGAATASSSSAALPTKLDTAKEAAALLMAGKAIDESGKKTKCETGVIAYGTDETEHSLQDLSEDYQHMKELQPLEPIHVEGIAAIYKLEPSSVEGDVLSALILATHLLTERTGRTKTMDRQIILFTDACSRLGSVDGLDSTVEQLGILGVRLKVVGLDFLMGTNLSEKDEDLMARFGGGEEGNEENEEEQLKRVRFENEMMLRSITKNLVGGELVDAVLFLEQVSSLRKRASSANSNLTLQFSSIFPIQVQASSITTVTRAPNLRKFAKRDPEKQALKMERSYHVEDQVIEAEDAGLAPEERVKGYKYGSEVLPVDETTLDSMKMKSDKVEISIIAIVPQHLVPRHYAISHALALKPRVKESIASVQLLSALGQALHKEKKLAIVRYVRRKNADPEVGVISPPQVLLSPDRPEVQKIRKIEEIPPYLVYNKLPFAEDVRGYPFRPLNDPRSPHWPSTDQQQTALAFVDALTLPTNPQTGTALRLAPHPGIKTIWRTIFEKVLRCVEAGDEEEDDEGGGAAAMGQDGEEGGEGGANHHVNGVPVELRPDPALWSNAQDAIDGFREEFTFQKVEPKAKAQMRTWSAMENEGDTREQRVEQAVRYGEEVARTTSAAATTGEENGGGGEGEGGGRLKIGGGAPKRRRVEEGEEGEGDEALPPAMQVDIKPELIAGPATTAAAAHVPTKVNMADLCKSLKAMFEGGEAITSAALQQLKAQIEVALEKAADGVRSYYTRSVTYIQDCRKAAIDAKRPAKEFNDFLREIKMGPAEGGKGDFWDLMKKDRVTLLKANEAQGGVSEAEAQRFLDEVEAVQVLPSQAAPAKMEEEEEGLEFD